MYEGIRQKNSVNIPFGCTVALMNGNSFSLAHHCRDCNQYVIKQCRYYQHGSYKSEQRAHSLYRLIVATNIFNGGNTESEFYSHLGQAFIVNIFVAHLLDRFIELFFIRLWVESYETEIPVIPNPPVTAVIHIFSDSRKSHK